MRKVSFFVCFFNMLFFTSATLANGFEEPQQAINAYITAVSTGSGEHVEKAYASDATIKFYDNEERYQEFTRESFAKAVNTGRNWDVVIEITSLRVTGKAASATVEFTWGENSDQGYVDYLNLIYINGSWKISNKVAQYISRK